MSDISRNALSYQIIRAGRTAPDERVNNGFAVNSKFLMVQFMNEGDVLIGTDAHSGTVQVRNKLKDGILVPMQTEFERVSQDVLVSYMIFGIRDWSNKQERRTRITFLQKALPLYADTKAFETGTLLDVINRIKWDVPPTLKDVPYCIAAGYIGVQLDAFTKLMQGDVT